MRLIDKQVRVNPETYTSELLVTVSIPWELMNTDAKQGEDAMAYKIISEKFIDILKSMTKQSAADRIFMNERIKELMEYAVRFRLDPDSNAYEALVQPEDLELFAELIVRECINIACEYDKPKLSGPGLAIACNIESHFDIYIEEDGRFVK